MTETCPGDRDLAGLLYPQCICCLPMSYLTICHDVVSISGGLSNLTLLSHFPKAQTCYSPTGPILLIKPYHSCVCRKSMLCTSEPCLVRPLPISWDVRGSGVVRRAAWDLSAPAAVYGKLASPCSLILAMVILSGSLLHLALSVDSNLRSASS